VAAGKSGVIGHVDWTVGKRDGSHTDPGPNFPWDVLMARVGAILGGGGVVIDPPAGDGSQLPTLRHGMKNDPRVASLQRFLNMEDWAPALPLLPVTGNYLDKTRDVVRAAQAQSGVTGPDADGTIVGPRTNRAFWARGWRG
jgi:hypothetical protein